MVMEYVAGGDLFHGFHAIDEDIVEMREKTSALKRQKVQDAKLLAEFEENKASKTDAEKQENFNRLLRLNETKQELCKTMEREMERERDEQFN
jgi:hypothetical protein